MSNLNLRKQVKQSLLLSEEETSEEQVVEQPSVALPSGIPHQTAAVFSMYLALIGKFLSNNIVFPFAPFMVRDFFPHISENKLGYYTGYLDSAFSCGPLVTSVLWARMSDKYGRKIAVMTGLFGTSIISCLFGLSPVYAVAVFVRFLWGAIDSCTVVVKTAMGDLAKNPEFTIDKARLFGSIGLAGGIGRTFGSFLGGWLGAVYGGENNDRKCNAFTRVFCEFPYFLPCLAPSILNAIALVMVWMYFPETLQSKSESNLSLSKVKVYQTENKNTDTNSSLISAAAVVSSDDRTNSNMNLLQSESEEDSLNDISDEMKVTWSDIWAEKDLMKAVLIYFLTCFYSSGFNSLLPVWLLTSNNEEGHGLDMRVHEIGTVWALVGPIYMTSQMFVYHRVCNWLGFLPSAQISLSVSALFCFFLPYLSSNALLGGFDSRSDLSSSQRWRNILCAALMAGLLVAFRVMAIATVNLIISDASRDDAKMRATAYGLSNTIGSLGRLLAPSVCCNMYAAIIAYDKHHSSALLNYTFPFALLSLTALTAALLIRYGFPPDFESKLREQVDKKRGQRKQPKTEEKPNKVEMAEVDQTGSLQSL